MIDFQSVFIRDTAELSQINFVAVLRIETESTSGLTEVLVNSVPAKFIKDPNGRVVYAQLPKGVSQTGLVDREGRVIQNGVSRIVLKRNVTTDENTEVVSEDVDIQGFLDPSAPADPTKVGNLTPVSFYAGILSLIGADFSQAVKVKINSEDVPFTIVSKHEILCSLPSGNTSSIESVDVITTSKTINRTTYFEYDVGANPSAVTGLQKLIQQFVKLLLTSPGSDPFNPSYGGNLQNFVGTNFSPRNPSSLVSQVTFRVIQCGIQMTARQTIAGVPDDERLSDVEVLNVTIDPDDPTIMQLSLRLNTFSGRSAQFSTMIGEALEFGVDQARSTLASTGVSVSGSASGTGSSGY